MATEKLNAKRVAAIKDAGRYGDGNGLWLVVSKTGSKRWAFRFRRPDTGAPTEMGLGSADNVSLAEAREAASAARKLRHQDGANPIQTRARAEKGEGRIPSFREAANDYVRVHSPSWKSTRHLNHWNMTLDVYCAPLHALPVNEITTRDILGIIEPIWNEKNETACRVRGRIEMILDRARTLGQIDANARNPAQWKGHLDKALKKRTVRGHHAALPYKEVPAFVAQLKADDRVSSAALLFTILTAARTGETIGATWSEIDLEAKTWTIPGERMKAKKKHEVPLSPPVMEILEAMKKLRTNDYVFPGLMKGKGLSIMAMEIVLRRLGKKDVATVHGFRSAFRKWAGIETTTQRELVEEALAHQWAGAVEGAYWRDGSMIKKRIQLMNDWADYCSENTN